MITTEKIFYQIKGMGFEVYEPNKKGEVRIERGVVKVCPHISSCAIYYNAYGDSKEKDRVRKIFEETNGFIEYNHTAGKSKRLNGMCWAKYDETFSINDLKKLIEILLE